MDPVTNPQAGTQPDQVLEALTAKLAERGYMIGPPEITQTEERNAKAKSFVLRALSEIAGAALGAAVGTPGHGLEQPVSNIDSNLALHDALAPFAEHASICAWNPTDSSLGLVFLEYGQTTPAELVGCVRPALQNVNQRLVASGLVAGPGLHVFVWLLLLLWDEEEFVSLSQGALPQAHAKGFLGRGALVRTGLWLLPNEQVLWSPVPSTAWPAKDFPLTDTDIVSVSRTEVPHVPG